MIDPLQPFGSARLKLARAGRHIGELDSEVAAFLATKPVALVVEQPADLAAIGACAWVARIRQHIPYELATIIGDAAHNLRSALDLLATDLVRLNGQNADSVYFPFAKDASGLEGQIKDKNMRRAHPDAVNLVRSLKPYTGGNAALRGLHDLDIRDKHRALIPAMSAARTNSFTLIRGASRTEVPVWESTIPSDGWRMLVLPLPANVPLGMEILATYSLIFQQDAPFPGRQVVPTLRSLHEHCTSIVEAFATLCKGQTFPEGTASNMGQKALIVGQSNSPATCT